MDSALRSELADSEDRHWWFEGRRAILESLLETFRLPPTARLLEAGCGNGANLALLARFGAVSAFEPDLTDLERAKRRDIGTVTPGHLPDRVPFDQERFDVVLSLDVIEHVDDDVAALKALGRRLGADGRLVVTVPAFPFLWGEHDERNGHRRRYTRLTLRRALEDSGFRIDRLSHFNTLLFPAVALVRLLGRPFGLDAGGTGVPPSGVNALLYRIFRAERRVIRLLSLPFGVSLLAIARPVGQTGP